MTDTPTAADLRDEFEKLYRNAQRELVAATKVILDQGKERDRLREENARLRAQVEALDRELGLLLDEDKSLTTRRTPLVRDRLADYQN